jgi:hypothetical protein
MTEGLTPEEQALMSKIIDLGERRAKPNGQAKTLPPSRVTGAAAFMRTYSPISYTIEGLLPSGYIYTLTAKTGAGKTAFAQAATLAVAMNRPDIIGLDVEPGRVAYVTLENPIDFKMKLAVGCHVHNIKWSDIDQRVAIIEGRDTPEQIAEGLKLDAEANGPFQLVNIDTLQAGFSVGGGGKFNENEDILAYVMRLRQLTELPGQPSVLVPCQECHRRRLAPLWRRRNRQRGGRKPDVVEVGPNQTSPY